MKLIFYLHCVKFCESFSPFPRPQRNQFGCIGFHGFFIHLCTLFNIFVSGIVISFAVKKINMLPGCTVGTALWDRGRADLPRGHIQEQYSHPHTQIFMYSIGINVFPRS